MILSYGLYFYKKSIKLESKFKQVLYGQNKYELFLRKLKTLKAIPHLAGVDII